MKQNLFKMSLVAFFTISTLVSFAQQKEETKEAEKTKKECTDKHKKSKKCCSHSTNEEKK